MEEQLMTIEELYEFAKKHGFENASMWVSTGTNVWSSINSANLGDLHSVYDYQQTTIYSA